MSQFTIEIKDNQVVGEALLFKLLRSQKSGRYRCELYSLDKRSLNQNSYMHTVFSIAQKGLYDAGYENIRTPQAAKDFYKQHFLTVETFNKQTGEVYKYIRHTSELPKEEMSFFIEDVRNYSLEYTGCYIPTSDEYLADYNRYDLVALAK